MTDRRPVYVVTGAARGIGREVARQLVMRNYQVLAAVRCANDVVGLQKELGILAVVSPCDVRQPDEVEKLFAQVKTYFGGLDGLVNNAATINPIGVLASTSPAVWRDALLTNLYGPYLCLAAALPLLVASGGGVVVNMLSGAASMPMEGWSAYCSTKAGLKMLSRVAHEEYSAQGVHVVGLAPGVVDTGMQAAIRESGINPISRLERTALSSVELPAQIVVRLLEGLAHAYTGQDLDVRDPSLLQACGMAM